MTDTGRALRLRRLRTDDHYLIVPMDHGLTMGPVDGLVDPTATVEAVAGGGADAVLCHRGQVDATAGASLGRIVHLNGTTALGLDPRDKRTVCSVASAVALGADAVSFHLNVASPHEGRQLTALGEVVDEAHHLGVPVLAMAYARGEGVDEHDPAAVAHAVRAVCELDVDLVKTACPPEGLERAIAGANAPVLIAGGEPAGDRGTLEVVAGAMEAGAAGVSMGRSIFQHERPAAMTAAVAAVVHDGASPAAAMDRLDGG